MDEAQKRGPSAQMISMSVLKRPLVPMGSSGVSSLLRGYGRLPICANEAVV
jgi:hypothetical protein